MILTYEPADKMLDFFREIGISMSDRATLPNLEDGFDKDGVMTILQKYLVLVEMPG
jgi:hypothetical protein